MLHGDQVVELNMLLEVHEEGEEEEDGEGQIEVESERGELKERRTWMACGWDEGSIKNILSHEVRVTQTSRCDNETTRSKCSAHKCNLRVSVFVYLCLLM